MNSLNCPHKFIKGPRKGLTCNKMTRTMHLYCNAHKLLKHNKNKSKNDLLNTIEVKKEVKEEVKEDIIEEVKEDIIKEVKEEVKEVNIIPDVLPTESTQISDIVIDDNTLHEDTKIVNGVYNKIKFKRLTNSTFDIKESTGRSICCIGASTSGKTMLFLKIIKMFFSSPKWVSVVMCDNCQNDVYKDLHNRIIKQDQFNPEIIELMQKINKKGRKKNKYNFFVGTDDIVMLRGSNTIKKLLMSFRNSCVSSLVILQGMTLIDRNSRNSCNYVIFKKNIDGNVIKDIMDYIGGIHPFFGLAMRQKIMLYKKITDDPKNFILLDNLKAKLFIMEYII